MNIKDKLNDVLGKLKGKTQDQKIAAAIAVMNKLRDERADAARVLTASLTTLKEYSEQTAGFAARAQDAVAAGTSPKNYTDLLQNNRPEQIATMIKNMTEALKKIEKLDEQISEVIKKSGL